MKKLTFIYLITLIWIAMPILISAQTGPGGIGNSTTNRVWLDASTLSQSNGSFVSAWSDKSGNGLTATPTYTSSRPVFRTNQLNGFPSIDFDGSGDHLKITNVPGISNQAISWFIVGNFNTLASSQAMLHFSHYGTASNKNLRYTLCYNNGFTTRINSGNLNNAGGGVPANHTFTTNSQILSTVIGATTINSYTNSNSTGSNTGTFLSPVNNNNYVSLGRRANLNDMYLDGNIAEVIVFNYQLTTPERIIVENYLSSKYSLALAVNDHYACETGGYYYNVTGIGMESGFAVTDAEGGSGIQINNASSLANGDYLLWGHNNASLTENVSDLPAEISDVNGSRLNRVWRIDETGDVGTYTIQMDMTGISLGVNPEDYVLLIDDDGDFSNGGTTVDSLNYSWDAINEIAVFSIKDLPDGAYFTLGYFPKSIYSVANGLWSNPANWSCNCIPTIAQNVTIKETHEITVDINAGCNNLDITATGSLLFTAGSELAITGNIESLGSLNGLDGVFTLSGNTPQTMEVSTADFDDFIMKNPAGATVVSGTLTIRSSLTITNGLFNIGNNLMTLNSDNNSTARIAPSTGTITGSMIIERYVAAQPDGWTTMSSPVASATFAQWEDDFALGFGPYIPNVSEPSAYGYSETAWDYYAIENNTYPINPTEGYEVYLASDYSVATPMVATVAELNGTPNIGDFTFNATVDNDGWNLIGNPYASFIDWETFLNNCGVSLSSEFMYFDEAINDYSVGYIGDEIAQSQGIWVEALEAGTITFHETDKTSSNSSAYRSSKEAFFALKVSSDLVKTTSHTYFRLDENANNHFVQGSDKSFFKHSDHKSPALFTHSSDGKKLRINELKAESELDIPVSFQAGLNGNYQIDMLNFEIAEAAGYNSFILEDKKTGVFYNLLDGAYLFEANTGDNSERFLLHLSTSTEIVAESDVSFNPASEGIWIEYEISPNPVSIKIYNALGQELQESIQADPNAGRILVKSPESFSGVYIIQVTCGDKTTSKQFYKY